MPWFACTRFTAAASSVWCVLWSPQKPCLPVWGVCGVGGGVTTAAATHGSDRRVHLCSRQHAVKQTKVPDGC